MAGGIIHSSAWRRRRQVQPAPSCADVRHQRTPMVDVMLAAVGILMITAPLLQVMPVDLPKTSAQQVGGKDEPLVVSLNSKDEVFLGDTKFENWPNLATN